MHRDLILVVGNQGKGKSLWAKLYCRAQTRLLVYDPFGSYPNVNFTMDLDHIAANCLDRGHFRFGASDMRDLDFLGNLAIVAGSCTLCVEECGALFTRGQDLDDWLDNLIYRGRHWSINLVLLAQRAATIPVAIRSQATRIVTFHQFEKADLNALSAVFSDNERIAQLKKFECLDYENGEEKFYSIESEVRRSFKMPA